MTLTEKAVKKSEGSMAIVEINDIRTECGDLFKFVKEAKEIENFESQTLKEDDEPSTGNHQILVPSSVASISQPDFVGKQIYIVEDVDNLKNYLKTFVVRP